jgi:hypothetical protein
MATPSVDRRRVNAVGKGCLIAWQLRSDGSLPTQAPFHKPGPASEINLTPANAAPLHRYVVHEPYGSNGAGHTHW